jgi:hypothetical protein
LYATPLLYRHHFFGYNSEIMKPIKKGKSL